MKVKNGNSNNNGRTSMNEKINSDSEKIIILHPDFEELKAEVEKLRTELSMLVLERDELLYQECKDIEMAYMLSVGALEYKAYEVECAILRQKRKAELIQAKRNRQEKIILAEIEETLDAEFVAYQEKLNERLAQVNAALIRSKGKLLTEEETREFKKLYRLIVKALHPDLHPDQSEEKIELFHNAVLAYELGDLAMLKVISTIVSGTDIPGGKSEGQVFLMKEKKRLTELLRAVRDRIAEIKSEFPYTMKALVLNRKKLEERRTELEEQIKQLNEVLTAYTEKIAELLK